ncbi:mycofactocin-coupled SDR family oxidoreductase [Nocardioides zeae]|uniref:Mycofactocin-coupled SDR family oxidoreductase n=1 Tax=Nocardioides imazamoxiresistens TaxID=3231893 RepID=A0ABU3PSP0_9ACTN|nr:mycofactocin-coupled SDR family oxidoreductase [Nocardioides zeae]MDT9592199.1 mycofactocin-coupled SDR family oxidoreductase [Nocardioides zeae]
MSAALTAAVPGRFAGQVVVISGAARGQGRAHAVRFAAEGADVVAFDICAPLRSPLHPASTPEDLAETARLVEAQGRRCLTAQVDARDLQGLAALAARAEAELGRLDTLIVNHGIWAIAKNSWELEEDDWDEGIDVMLGGAWKVTKAFIPSMIRAGNGGSVILTSSAMGQKAQPAAVAYTAAKHGVLGLMRTLAWELGDHGIRANAIMPGTIASRMTQEGGTVEQSAEWWPRFFSTDRSLLQAGWMEPDVIAAAASFLASSDAAFLTGVALPVDAGWSTF